MKVLSTKKKRDELESLAKWHCLVSLSTIKKVLGVLVQERILREALRPPPTLASKAGIFLHIFRINGSL